MKSQNTLKFERFLLIAPLAVHLEVTRKNHQKRGRCIPVTWKYGEEFEKEIK